MDRKLSPDEDSELRRLHLFRKFGNVATRLQRRYDELRLRDRRSKVRDPQTSDMANQHLG